MNINDQVNAHIRTQCHLSDKLSTPVNDIAWILVEYEVWNRIWIQICLSTRLQLLDT